MVTNGHSSPPSAPSPSSLPRACVGRRAAFPPIWHACAGDRDSVRYGHARARAKASLLAARSTGAVGTLVAKACIDGNGSRCERVNARCHETGQGVVSPHVASPTSSHIPAHTAHSARDAPAPRSHAHLGAAAPTSDAPGVARGRALPPPLTGALVAANSAAALAPPHIPPPPPRCLCPAAPACRRRTRRQRRRWWGGWGRYSGAAGGGGGGSGGGRAGGGGGWRWCSRRPA